MYVSLHGEKERREMTEKLLYWVWLTKVLEFSTARIGAVYRKFSPEEAYHASRDVLEDAGIDDNIIDALENKDLTDTRKIVERCTSLGIKIVTANSSLYPRMLERLKDKPYIIYVRGDLACLKRRCAAFVGTRRMTKKGEEIARDTATSLLDRGYTLISGVADGIDTVPALISIERGKPFVAVMGVDIDKYYPASNKSLIDKIAKNGAVISEYPPFTNGRYFVDRNRIIAGLADETYVIEAPEMSGAISTGEASLRLGNKTFAPDEEGMTFKGCKYLLKKGANPIGGEKKKREKKKEMPVLDGTRLYIYEKLMKGSFTDEELINEDHPVTEVLTALTELELDGLITALPGGKYKLN